MTSPLFSSELLARLRRPVLLGGVVFLSIAAAGCGDDDDDDGGTGPSADCIEEAVAFLEFFGADEDDAEPIGVGDDESGSLSSNDVEFQGFFTDFWVIGTESDGDLNIEVDPSGFDADIGLFTADGDFVAGADEGFEGDPEEISESVDEGCYVLGVSSFEEGETGSYTISVND